MGKAKPRKVLRYYEAKQVVDYFNEFFKNGGYSNKNGERIKIDTLLRDTVLRNYDQKTLQPIGDGTLRNCKVPGYMVEGTVYTYTQAYLEYYKQKRKIREGFSYNKVYKNLSDNQKAKFESALKANLVRVSKINPWKLSLVMYFTAEYQKKLLALIELEKVSRRLPFYIGILSEQRSSKNYDDLCITNSTINKVLKGLKEANTFVRTGRRPLGRKSQSLPLLEGLI